jgi:hypothetical protein
MVILADWKRTKEDFVVHFGLVVTEENQVQVWQSPRQVPFLGEVEEQESLDAPFHFD